MDIEINSNINIIVKCYECDEELEVVSVSFYQDELEVEVMPHICEDNDD